MGEIEKDVAQKIRRTKVQKAVLATLATAGVLSVALVAPNALKMLEIFDKGRHRRRADPKYAAQKAFWKLVDRGFIYLEETKSGTKRARLTSRGKDVVKSLERENSSLKRPKRWDGKWRILTFDIREERRRIRDQLRITLKHLGFLQLQRSVWVYPYDCEDFTILLKADFRIGREVLYVVADRIEGDSRLKRHFNIHS